MDENLGLDDNYPDVLELKREPKKIEYSQIHCRCWKIAGKTSFLLHTCKKKNKKSVKIHNSGYSWLLLGFYVSQKRDKK